MMMFANLLISFALLQWPYCGLLTACSPFTEALFSDGFESQSVPGRWNSQTIADCHSPSPDGTISVQTAAPLEGAASLRLSYLIGAGECSSHQDENLYVSKHFDSGAYSNGLDSVKVSMRVRFHVNAGGTTILQRKLLFVQDAAQSWSFFPLSTQIDQLKFRVGGNGGCGAAAFSSDSDQQSLPTYAMDTTYDLATAVRLNTPGLSDGMITVWVNGAQVWTRSNLNLRGTCTSSMQRLRFGFQADRFNFDPVDEYRDIDAVSVTVQ